VDNDRRKRPDKGEPHTETEASSQSSPGSPLPAAAPHAPAPGRHLLALIVDALTMPGPADTPQDETAHLLLVSRRAGLVHAAARKALDGSIEHAARDLAAGLACLPPDSYTYAPASERTSV
jgi:hypothetical protein